MDKNKVIIIGAGGHSFVVASILRENDIDILGFFDDDDEKIGKRFFGIPVLGKISELQSNPKVKAVIGIGNNRIRKEIAMSLQFDWINAIHPFSFIDRNVKIGIGTVICAGAIVQIGAEIGEHTIINTKSSIDHDCNVSNYCHVAAAHLAGGSSIDEGVFVALNSTVLPGVNVGSWAIIGAGSVVTKDVDPDITVVGVPAKPI